MENIYKKYLFDYQKKAFDFLKHINKHMIALDMGLGKTITSLALLEEKFISMQRKTALIICQKTKINDWIKEVKTHFPNLYVLPFVSRQITIKEVKKHRPRIKKEKIPSSQIDRLKMICDFYRQKDVIIVTIYTLARTRSKFIAMILHGATVLKYKYPKNTFLIVDESQVMKNKESAIGIWGEKVAKQINYVSLLSGDPISNSYLDLFQQMKIMGMSLTWKEWTRHFCVFEKMESYKKEWWEIIGFKNVNKLMKNLKSKAYFLKTEDCLDFLPKQKWQIIRTLNSFYPLDMLKKYKVLNDLNFKEPSTYFLAQRQLASGFLYEHLFVDEQKINISLYLLFSTNDNFVIYYNFVNELKLLKMKLFEKKISFLEINGQKNQYEEIAKIKLKSKKVLLIQYLAGSTGLNLEKFNRMIFFSPTTSAGNYKQAIKRIHRLGQEKICFYYQLIVNNSVEEDIFKANQLGIDYTTIH